jgi:Fibrinogen beta and gamma chains, C-terminal globular domain
LANDTIDGVARIINGKQFLAADKNNGRTCPSDVQGGWWFTSAEMGNFCSASRLLGKQQRQGSGFQWMSARKAPNILQTCRMMIKTAG